MKLFLSLSIYFLSIQAVSQPLIPLPDPVNSAKHEWNGVMLPDSSVMLTSNRLSEDIWKCHRFTFRNKSWVESPSQLDSLINALIITETIPNFRFSADYTQLILTLYQGLGNDTHFYETEYKDGRWSFFKEILPGNPQSLWHGLSISNDHMLLYGTTRKGQLYEYKKANGNWVLAGEITAFSKMTNEIQQPIPVGKNGLLFKGTYVASRRDQKTSFFYTTRLADGSWTAPHIVEGVVGSDVSFHPLKTHFFFNDYLPSRFNDIGYGIVPKFLQKEFQQSAMHHKSAPVITASQQFDESKDKRIKPGGKYFALLIGNGDYQLNELDLDNPKHDVEKLSQTLISQYQFAKENVHVVLNADRTATFKELFQLRKNITSNDNLLIFYAGHGYFDEQVNQGYWWPVDASIDNPSNWLSNSDLIEQIRAIKSAHTLLISDACFSGALFKTRGAEDITRANLDIQLLYRMPSRRAITSGTMNKVPDKSVFFHYLVKYLDENKEPFISAGELFSSIRKAVISNSIVVPQEGVIMNTGDEGGDFIFMRKE